MLALKAENISKQYRLGQVGTGTLSHDLNRFWHQVRGKEDPYLKIGEANDRASKGESEYVWSLRDISFEIEQGDAVGIIGRNGAGKSTLLKLLSKVTKPTTGKIHTNGRIASLLEVGTGFHPEMTGRENIYLNGAILGMTRKEIKRKFDEIVDFSGVERYIDTPVKRYSSGMYVRLAFAVAAHLESEILIVDEVLAVGDAEFQKKCLGKMGDVSKGEGRTVLFVSHNLTAVKTLCNSGIVLKNGNLVFNGEINEALINYSGDRLKESMGVQFDQSVKDYNSPQFSMQEIKIVSANGLSLKILEQNTEFFIQTKCFVKTKTDRIHLSFVFKNSENLTIFTSTNNHDPLKVGENIVKFKIPANFLNVDKYSLDLYVIINKQNSLVIEEDILTFTVLQNGREAGDWMGKEPGFITTHFEWSYD
ncbi:ABC transporter ATP-binding protein [Chryseobacterium sp. SNU WT5]|uniref:ABC transporter ATP-binding protein n=1 Tax=Chryseobacterium sp. SNU WT5 TaxID=2594269 RepID=UPI00118028D7|nr:ABC transporter ATP-binding protein [Chryseobacterium sp. SNU WT5]QDP85550.1 ABC transporter ATP-binding protein [Chryseobacterium sp. SNU WT5]